MHEHHVGTAHAQFAEQVHAHVHAHSMPKLHAITQAALKAAASQEAARAAWEAEKAEAKQERTAPARPSSTRLLCSTGRPQRAPAFPPANWLQFLFTLQP